jgi:TolA-binding protein
MNEIEVVTKEVLSVPDRANLIIVKDQVSLTAANQVFLDIKGLRKKIEDTFSPIISAAHRTHQEAIAQRKKIEEPLIVAEKYLNGQVTAYHQEIEKKRREEEEVARQKAIVEEMARRKAEEEARIAQAAELEAAGATEEAEALITETVEDNQKPLEVYVPPPATPKVELEGATVKTYWQAEVTDLRALCRAVADGKAAIACVEPNMTVLNAQARALKKEMAIPGVRAVSTSSMASTGKRKAA